MMTALATVTKVVPLSRGYKIELSCEQQTSCSQCASVKSCGTGMVSKAIGNKALLWQLLTDKPVSTGQVVEIGLPEKGILQSAALVYLTPLFMMFIGAAVGHVFSIQLSLTGEALVILTATIFMTAGVWLAKWLAKRIEAVTQQQVILLRILGEPIV